jgi:hypothetical protein
LNSTRINQVGKSGLRLKVRQIQEPGRHPGGHDIGLGIVVDARLRRVRVFGSYGHRLEKMEDVKDQDLLHRRAAGL